MAKSTVYTLSPKLAGQLPEVARRVLGDGGGAPITPYGGNGGELWGQVTSTTTLAGKTNRFVYKMKLFSSPFMATDQCVKKADNTPALVDALNTVEQNNTATLGSEYTLSPSATTCTEKSVKPIAADQSRYRLSGPYKNPDDSKYYYAFTARNDPIFGDGS